MWIGLICIFICMCSLAGASVYDIKTHSVPDFIWWILATNSLFIPIMISMDSNCLFVGPAAFDICSVFDLLLVVFIQEKIMSRYYGRADSHAFSCCGFYFFFGGNALWGHILHLAITLALLFFVQQVKGNIKRTGSLKAPVPFIPYIGTGFIIVVIIMKRLRISL